MSTMVTSKSPQITEQRNANVSTEVTITSPGLIREA